MQYCAGNFYHDSGMHSTQSPLAAEDLDFHLSWNIYTIASTVPHGLNLANSNTKS